jgi:hypothetical protein
MKKIILITLIVFIYTSLLAISPGKIKCPELLGDDSAAYALLYVYRPNALGGSFVSYNLYLDDSLLCRVKNNTRFIFKLYKEGLAKVSAKAGVTYNVELNVKFGESYYIFCALDAGFPHSTPHLLIKDESIGSKDFEMVKGRKGKKEKDDNDSTNNKQL